MKINLVLIVILAFFYISAVDVPQTCNSESFADECVPKLTTGFNFLKSYKIDGTAKDKVEYSYVFTKGTQYFINLCNSGAATDGIVVNIFDKERNKVASNKISGQYVSAISFPCNATGIYYIQYTFDEPSGHCGGSAMGFKR
ncbi:MAG: hypothetical protein MUF39_02000 [Cyclobacteriaceae bacterium]|jgi:hypothetical protein|nr:hypothetical protein [Cyclobacteriaceae bacterium]